MKPNISLARKKSPCFPPVKMVLGQLAPRKIAPNLNPNAKPNPNPNRGAIFLGGTNKSNKKPKRNK